MRYCPGCDRRRAARFWRSQRSEKCVDCQKKARRRASRNTRIEKTYGITAEEYDAILEAQGGVCAGCGEKRRYYLHVDHDHALERLYGTRASIRGLLCARCNKVLRDVRDIIAVLEGLAEYLRNPPARRVLGSH